MKAIMHSQPPAGHFVRDQTTEQKFKTVSQSQHRNLSGVSEQFLNGTSAQNRLFSTIKLKTWKKSRKFRAKCIKQNK